MEGFLLLAKLHYFSANYAETLQDVDNSKLDAPKTQFETLRSLKLAAEGYAIKGLAIEHTIRKDRDKYYDLSRKRMLNCFETSAELTISYIAELEKVMNSSKPGRRHEFPGSQNVEVLTSLTINIQVVWLSRVRRVLLRLARLESSHR